MAALSVSEFAGRRFPEKTPPLHVGWENLSLAPARLAHATRDTSPEKGLQE